MLLEIGNEFDSGHIKCNVAWNDVSKSCNNTGAKRVTFASIDY